MKVLRCEEKIAEARLDRGGVMQSIRGAVGMSHIQILEREAINQSAAAERHHLRELQLREEAELEEADEAKAELVGRAVANAAHEHPGNLA
eukprot:tig00000269_g23769.t1